MRCDQRRSSELRCIVTAVKEAVANVETPKEKKPPKRADNEDVGHSSTHAAPLRRMSSVLIPRRIRSVS